MTHDNTINETVNVLTERISQILDGAKHLTNINMGSERGRQFVAATIARQLIDGGALDTPGDVHALPNVL